MFGMKGDDPGMDPGLFARPTFGPGWEWVPPAATFFLGHGGQGAPWLARLEDPGTGRVFQVVAPTAEEAIAGIRAGYTEQLAP